MKLLFDQNLSFKLVNRLAAEYPQSAQLRQLSLDIASDYEVWKYAHNNNFTIVTQDADFDRLSQLYGFPPKIIWLRCGNTSTTYIENLLREYCDVLLEFEKSSSLTCIELR